MYSPTNLGAPIVEWSTHGAHARRLLRNFAHAFRDAQWVTFLAGLDQFLGTTDLPEEQYDALLAGGLCDDWVRHRDVGRVAAG